MKRSKFKDTLVYRLSSTDIKPTAPFHPYCSVCHRDDTEGCLDTTDFNVDDYRDCCDRGSLVGGTLFKTRSDRVICVDCIHQLGVRGKEPHYGVTLAMLVLAGVPVSTIVAFAKADFVQEEGRCAHTAEEIRHTRRCIPCELMPSIHKSFRCSRARTVKRLQLSPRCGSVPSLQCLSRVSLSSADMGTLRQLQEQLCIA